MGQNSSSSREQDNSFRRRSRMLPIHDEESTTPVSAQNQETGEHTVNVTRTLGLPSTENTHSLHNAATFRRQISAQSTIAVGGDSSVIETGTSTQDAVVFEQEERPLMGMGDLGMRDAPITHITASPMPRRSSVLSRLGQRIRPSSTASRSSGQPMIAEERGLRETLTSNSAQSHAESNGNRPRHRSSVFGALPSSFLTHASSTSRRRLAPISRPMPLADSEIGPQFGLADASRHAPTPDQSSIPQQRPLSGFAPISRRTSRISRIRRSISGTLDTLIGNNGSYQPGEGQPSSPPQRPSRAQIADETDYLLPPPSGIDANLDPEELLNGPAGPAERSGLEAFPLVPETPERPQSWAQRWADRSPAARREGRRMPSLLRGRSSRLIRRDDEIPLSRILQLAAAAIAAQLSGSTDAMANMEAVGGDHFDGGLNTFVEELNQHAASGGQQRARTTLPPLNFWRVFRFVNNDQAGRSEVSQDGGSPNEEESTDNRTVTLVVVGVRSVPSSSINRETGEGIVDSSLDTLMSLPVVPNPNAARNGAGGGLLRSSSGRARFAHRRRSSLGGVNPFPAQYDSQRHQRGTTSSRPASGTSTPTATIPIVLSDSPPGPNPPPSTPAEPSLLSGNSTPTSRPSSASIPHNLSRHHNENMESVQESHESGGIIPTQSLQADQGVRQRRRSDSEQARHRDLGAGAARRNGVVEPDDAHGQGRSWLIYVVGTNLSEDHPAFAAPSLFTDVSPQPPEVRRKRSHADLSFFSQNPTYEDMMLLSSLLGPAKPPVASRNDVASSRGVYRVTLRNPDGMLTAAQVDGPDSLQIVVSERCLICLEEYLLDEELRQLRCGHPYHRGCIDEVSFR